MSIVRPIIMFLAYFLCGMAVCTCIVENGFDLTVNVVFSNSVYISAIVMNVINVIIQIISGENI